MLYLCKYRTLPKNTSGYRIVCIVHTVCMRACECVCVRLCVCVFVLVRPLAWERYTQDCSTRTLSLARYILYGVKLKPNTHQNETTTESEANRIRRTEGKSSLETLWHLHTGNLYNCIEMPTHHPLNFKGKGNPWLWIKQHNIVSRLLYHGSGGKNEKNKKTVYRLDISHIWKYGFPELTFLVITKSFLFSPLSSNKKEIYIIHSRYYFSYRKWFSNVKFWNVLKIW